MFWFEKNHPNVIFGDKRNETHVLCDGRNLEISPDTILDFTNLPYKDNSFKLVVFDPPHLKNLGKNSYMAKKYGVLTYNWMHDIKDGFDECMRVLEPFGILIFKWNETQIKTSTILDIIGHKPLFGHISGKSSKTIWMCFMKINNIPQ